MPILIDQLGRCYAEEYIRPLIEAATDLPGLFFSPSLSGVRWAIGRLQYSSADDLGLRRRAKRKSRALRAPCIGVQAAVCCRREPSRPSPQTEEVLCPPALSTLEAFVQALDGLSSTAAWRPGLRGRLQGRSLPW